MKSVSGLTGMQETSTAKDTRNGQHPPLAFAGTDPKRFVEDTAVEQLKEMW